MNRAQITNKIKNIIQKRRANADDFALKNYTEASVNPHFSANASNIAAATIQIARLESENKPTKHEKELLKVLENERRQILADIKLDPKDLTPKYFCKKCSDTGIAEGQYCECYKTLMNEELSKLNGGSLDKKHTFGMADMKLIKKDSDIFKAYTNMQKFCEVFPASKRKVISLVGQVGVGKSYLIECVCNALIEKGALVQFVTAFNFNNTMLKYHTEFNSDKMLYLDSLLEPDVLVIDDLGTEPMLRNVTKEYLFLVLNERINLGKFTLITTNLGLDEILDRYGERLYSRLTHKQNAVAINVTGDDLRRKIK